MALPATAGLPSPTWLRPRTEHLLPPSGAAEAASFEVHPEPQFLVDASGHILRGNLAGRQLLASSPEAAAFPGRLVASAGTRMRALRALVAEAIRSQAPSAELELIFSPSSSMAFRAVPLGAAFAFALVLVRPNPARVAGSVSERFNFTPAESLVATRLTRGLTVGEIALQLGISIETVRCHLKQAFVKAGVHRQAELVAVMLRG